MRQPDNICIIFELKNKGVIPRGKHEAHPPHHWWYTRYGGGHQMPTDFVPSEWVSPNEHTGYDETEHDVTQWYCPGD